MASISDPSIATFKRPTVRISTANTNRDGSTGTYGTLYTAGALGAFFRTFRWTAEGDTSAGAIRLFIQAGGAGNFELAYEGVVPATTFSAGTTPIAQGTWMPAGGILLQGNSVVKVSTHVGDTFGCALEVGGDF